MEELVNIVQSKTGLSEAKAKQAVEVVSASSRRSCHLHWLHRSMPL
jgi:hypothetical protein